MKTRFLRYAAASYRSLKNENPPFNFARRHALRLYRSNAIYSFIPKNACSTLRLSLAIFNGTIKTPDDFNWIHSNTYTFSAELADLATADYTFVVLRCPFRRVASTYLDKIVNRDVAAWHLQNKLKYAMNPDEFTFSDFVKQMKKKAIRKSNIHWREQVDFLVYEEYDDYFCLENFDDAIVQLKQKIGLNVVDARSLTNHGSDNYLLLDETEDFSRAKPLDLLFLKKEGKYPHPKSLFNEESIEIVKDCYKDDVEQYASIFGTSNLLFA